MAPLAGVVATLLLLASPGASAQDRTVPQDSASVRSAPSIPRLVAGGLVGGIVGTAPGLLFWQGCEPEAEECLADAARIGLAGAGYLIAVPVGVHVAGRAHNPVWRPLASAMAASAFTALVSTGWDARLAYAIPVVHLVASVAAVR